MCRRDLTTGPPGPIDGRAPSSGAASSGRRVLLVEDNPGDAELVRIALSAGEAGFALHHVERLADALEHVTRNAVDAVLLDLALPDASGIGCVDALRAAAPDLPIVILTGMDGSWVEAVRSGVQDYIVKGELDARALQRTIDYAIERNAHARRARELDRERAARAAAERRQHEMEALFASMIDPVLVYAEDRRVTSTNPAAQGFFGRDVRGLLPAALIEEADIRLSSGARVPVESLPACRALAGVAVTGERLRVRTPAGNRVVLVSASPLWRGATIAGAVCVYRDVTEHDRAEQSLRESDERKNHFLAMLSHELRNPLAPIRNSVYILERAAPGGEQARRARTVIDRQVHHLTRLIDDLLDVTRISRGKISLHRERLDLPALARHVAEDHRSVFTANGIELETVAAGPPALHVTADPTRIAQMIGNLLHNASKFTPRGGRTVLSVERVDDRLAAVRVRDTGRGIAPAVLENVFEPFVQGDRTLDRSHGGLGLGLALVKGLAELHGGTVTASSDGEGKGAEFVVTLPLDGPADAPTDAAPPSTTLPACRILIIEDNPDTAQTLREVLELGDHVVDTAGSGPEGLEKARHFRPEVVLCDIGLPTMDGFAVASAMRTDPALRTIPLVALSGYAAPSDLERAAEAGFDRHLAKPVDLDELERVVSELAARRRA
jgi:signal transduction histidine kinase